MKKLIILLFFLSLITLKADIIPPSGGGGIPGGNNKTIQYNNNGSFAGDDKLVWDSGLQRLGLGTNNPQSALHIVDSSSATLRGIFSFNYTNSGNGSKVAMIGGRGTAISPSPVLSGDSLGFLSFGGYFGTNVNNYSEQVSIGSDATENWSSTARGCNIRFYTTPNGTTTAQLRMMIHHNGNVSIGTASSSNILTIQQNSPTDPIADAWLTYSCDREHKEIISQSVSVLDKFKSIPVYRWKKKPLVSDEEVMIEAELKPQRDKKTGQEIQNKIFITKEMLDKNPELKNQLKDDISVILNKFNQKKEELATKKATLPKYTAERIGIMVDDPQVPREILAFDEKGNIVGIDLLAWIGYLHSALKEEVSKREMLEQKVNELENRISRLEIGR
jgi:hypothetical protein